MLLVDSHCHLDSLDYQGLHTSVDDVVAKAKSRDVGFMLAVATTLPGFRAMTSMIGERPEVAFSCGVHPLNLDGGYDFQELRTLAAAENVVAMGETGWTTSISRIIFRYSKLHSASIFVLAGI